MVKVHQTEVMSAKRVREQTPVQVGKENLMIAPDRDQPGGELRKAKGNRLVKSILLSARAIKARDSGRD
jgi:hypothetical protein